MTLFTLDWWIALQVVAGLGVGLLATYLAVRPSLRAAERQADEHFFKQVQVQREPCLSQEGTIVKTFFLNIRERLVYKGTFPLTSWADRKITIERHLATDDLIELAESVTGLLANGSFPVVTSCIQKAATALASGKQK